MDTAGEMDNLYFAAFLAINLAFMNLPLPLLWTAERVFFLILNLLSSAVLLFADADSHQI